MLMTLKAHFMAQLIWQLSKLQQYVLIWYFLNAGIKVCLLDQNYSLNLYFTTLTLTLIVWQIAQNNFQPVRTDMIFFTLDEYQKCLDPNPTASSCQILLDNTMSFCSDRP